MTLGQEFASWFSPSPVDTSPVPTLNSKAPSRRLNLFERTGKRPIIITFLRHCGCPFQRPVAEKTFVELRALAASNPDIYCIAVSHSDQSSTDTWVDALGGAGNIDIAVDAERLIYAEWGLGISSWSHVLSPASLWGAVQLGRLEGIWNRPTESGSRWQTAGSFAVDAEGAVKWVDVSDTAKHVSNFEDGLRSLKYQESQDYHRAVASSSV